MVTSPFSRSWPSEWSASLRFSRGAAHTQLCWHPAKSRGKASTCQGIRPLPARRHSSATLARQWSAGPVNHRRISLEPALQFALFIRSLVSRQRAGLCLLTLFSFPTRACWLAKARLWWRAPASEQCPSDRERTGEQTGAAIVPTAQPVAWL